MKTTFIFLLLSTVNHFSFSQWNTNPAVNNPVVTAVNQQNSQQIISDGSGGAILVYMDYNSSLNERSIYAQRVNASGVVQWGAAGVPVCTVIGNQQNPQLASDANGGAIMVWQDNRIINTPEIYAQRINSAGIVQWTVDGITLGDGSGINHTQPQLIPDGSGGAFVTWKAVFPPNASIRAQHIDANGNILWATGGVFVTNSTTPELPQIISDGAGGMIISWNEFVGPIATGAHDIFAQRLNSTGVVQWGPSGTSICNAVNAQTGSQLVSDGSNGAIICWKDFRAGSGLSNIYAQRVNSSGIVQWTVNGVATAPAASSQLSPMIMSDGSSGAFITWNNNSTVYAQRMSSGGALLWGASGKLVRFASGSEPQIVTDGGTGSIITWSNGIDVFAQRLDINGNFQWVSTGAPVCSESTASQIIPKMVATISGGAIIVWIDSRNNATTETDLYASRVLSNGTLPVSLLNFEYKKINTAIQLHWQTAFEQNSDHFNIERSNDGNQFLSLGSINASGNSQTMKDYYYTDYNPLNGINYYRLKQVDKDGNYKYSKVLNADMQKKNQMLLYPNPAADHTELVFNKPAKGTVVVIFNASGQILKTITVADGQTRQLLDISSFPRGEYMIRINDESTGLLKLVKQ